MALCRIFSDTIGLPSQRCVGVYCSATFHLKGQIPLLALEQFAKILKSHPFVLCILMIYISINIYIYIGIWCTPMGKKTAFSRKHIDSHLTDLDDVLWFIQISKPEPPFLMVRIPCLVSKMFPASKSRGRAAHVLDMLRHYGGVPDSCFAANLGRVAWIPWIWTSTRCGYKNLGFFHGRYIQL